MHNTAILNALRDIISDLESKGPTIRCSSLFYLINSLYLCHDLEMTFKEYLRTNEHSLTHKVSAKSSAISLFLRKTLENNDIPQKNNFILMELHKMTGHLMDDLMGLDEHTPTLEEIKNPNDFIIKNLEEICDELVKLNYPITHENNERCLKVESWWKQKVQSKKAT